MDTLPAMDLVTGIMSSVYSNPEKAIKEPGRVIDFRTNDGVGWPEINEASNDFTFMCECYYDSDAGRTGTWCNLAGDGTDGSGSGWYPLRGPSAVNNGAYNMYNNLDDSTAASTAGSLPDDEWFIWGIVKTGTNVQMYKNGIPVTMSDSVISDTINLSGTYWIGKYDGSSNLYGWSGWVSWHGFWNRAMSDEEVRNIGKDPFQILVPK